MLEGFQDDLALREGDGDEGEIVVDLDFLDQVVADAGFLHDRGDELGLGHVLEFAQGDEEAVLAFGVDRERSLTDLLIAVRIEIVLDELLQQGGDELFSRDLFEEVSGKAGELGEALVLDDLADLVLEVLFLGFDDLLDIGDIAATDRGFLVCLI